MVFVYSVNCHFYNLFKIYNVKDRSLDSFEMKLHNKLKKDDFAFDPKMWKKMKQKLKSSPGKDTKWIIERICLLYSINPIESSN